LLSFYYGGGGVVTLFTALVEFSWADQVSISSVSDVYYVGCIVGFSPVVYSAPGDLLTHVITCTMMQWQVVFAFETSSPYVLQNDGMVHDDSQSSE
jgi:hypothetical protein